MLASFKVDAVIVPPLDFCNILLKIEPDMRTIPRLELPDDSYRNIWAYFSALKVTLVAMEAFY